MKFIVPAAVAAVLALGACSQGEDKAVEPAAAEAEAAPPAPPAGLARTAFDGLPPACIELADKMDHYRGCAVKMVEGQVSAEDAAAEAVQSRQRAESMAADLRKLPVDQAAEACSANHELMDKMGQAATAGC